MLDVTPALDAHQMAVAIKPLDPWDDPRSLTTFQTFPRTFNGFGDTREGVWFDRGSTDRIRNGQLNGSLPSSNTSSILSFDGQQNDDLVISITLKPEDRRFGFSVVGGSDEGFGPRIDTLTKGSPADRADLEVGDEILEVNGRSLENCTHTEVISHIHQCIRSRTICLRVKRKTGTKLALDLAQNSNVQDAFVIAVEQQARERLEKLSALKKIKPVDMTKLSQELNEFPHPELNGVIESNPIYVTSVPDIQNATLERLKKTINNNEESSVQEDQRLDSGPNDQCDSSAPDQELELTQEIIEDEVTIHGSPCDNSSAVVRTVEVNVHETDPPAKEPQAMEIGRHREMAVDVPETFVGVTKTPPRYPPPKPSDSLNRKKVSSLIIPDPPSRVVAKPTSESKLFSDATLDGKSVIKLQQNGRTSPTKGMNGVTSVDVTSGKNLKEEQIERIRKYQEDLKKRKEEEERIAKEEEFLRSSLRGSKKLQALESNPPVPAATQSGVVNTAFELEEGDSGTLPVGQALPSRLIGDVVDRPDAPELRRIVGAPELLQSLHRIETHLKSNGHRSEDLASVEHLMHDAEFQKLLAVHNKVQEIWCFQCPPSPISNSAADLVQEVMNSLQECSLPEAAELVDILSKYELEGLVYSHDKIAEKQVVPAMTPDEELLERASQYTDESVKIVRIDKTNEPLGATVRNEGEAVIIGRIVKGGAAEKSGLLHEGDEILEVNGIEMRGKSVNDVCDILATMVGTLTFLIIPSQYEKTKTPSKETVMHIKAHFDYDPDDDLYIPCRELGISFQKGDILHIINQDDPNWWQAYREGEEDQTLAGLIPSKNFQQQREVMKQTIVGEQNKEKIKKAKFLCAKKHHKKKKKKVLYTANEEFDVDQVLTYEEVALYYPRANQKRPIVLIGPPNIGRHELRQRLMENTERFAAAVPHTSRTRKDGEVDGVDYHFISRPQFEADILGGKFVEHGEYEKSYYGTSLEAIRTVVNSGKICILNLHPQSLKILKHSDLKPYVVFVAPPSLEKLRQNRLRMGASAKDDELKDIIEKARDMEESYGHYFDMIIINSETEKAYNELVKDISILEKEPQWVPAIWLSNDPN